MQIVASAVIVDERRPDGLGGGRKTQDAAAMPGRKVLLDRFRLQPSVLQTLRLGENPPLADNEFGIPLTGRLPAPQLLGWDRIRKAEDDVVDGGCQFPVRQMFARAHRHGRRNERAAREQAWGQRLMRHGLIVWVCVEGRG